MRSKTNLKMAEYALNAVCWPNSRVYMFFGTGIRIWGSFETGSRIKGVSAQRSKKSRKAAENALKSSFNGQISSVYMFSAQESDFGSILKPK